MNHSTTHLYEDVINATHYQPAVTITLPFNPGATLRSELEHRLKLLIHEAGKQLLQTYPANAAEPVVQKLEAMIPQISVAKARKSLCIFASPLTERIYYLDVMVDEKIVIDESFEIRDLIYNKKEIHTYLLFLISAAEIKAFIGYNNHLKRVPIQVPDHVAAYQRHLSEQVSNFSDASQQKEVLLDKFLHHADEGLGKLLQEYPLPLFVMGAERTLGHFMKITRHKKQIAGYTHGNFEAASEKQIHSALAPQISAWRQARQLTLLADLDAARGAGKLATGIQAVWDAAVNKKGRLVVVEKNYTCPAHKGSTAGELILEPTGGGNNTLFIKDAVDDIIEMVLASGGDVAFTDEGALYNYQRIALVQYY
jgi:Bacterial archaeo-eukaryotic release factor family 3